MNILRGNVQQKDGYTFVHNECGGGNAWRCSVVGVFAVRQGQFQYIGDAIGTERKGAVWNNYSDGLFMDLYDKFETNELTSHAGAPSLEIYSRDHDGRLCVDLETTWQRNLGRFEKGKEVWSQFPIKEEMSDEEAWSAKYNLLPTLLEQAVIAKYCDQLDDLEGVLRKADQSFPDDIMRDFLVILGEVIPCELPKREFVKIQ